MSTKTKWTEWHQLINPVGDMIAEYRDNGRNVEVRITNDMLGYGNGKVIRSTAICHNDDEFDLGIGIHIAYLKCEQKYLANEIENLECEIGRLNEKKNALKSRMVNNKSVMKRMAERR